MKRGAYVVNSFFGDIFQRAATQSAKVATRAEDKALASYYEVNT